jgi:hypothetical protein
MRPRLISASRLLLCPTTPSRISSGRAGRSWRRSLSFLLAFVVTLVAVGAPAILRAQVPTKVFVASFGNDANDGSRGSPKRNFQAAHDAVAAGGQIVVLDTAGYGSLTINKSIAVTVPPGVNGFITVANTSTDGVLINAGSSDVVSLRGLIVEGKGSQAGIHCTAGGTLIVEDCAVRNFASGILMTQTADGRLQVHGSSLRGNSVGVEIHSVGAAALDGVVNNCLLENNTDAAAVAYTEGSGTTRLTTIDCILTANRRAYYSIGSGANAVIYADNCRAQSNTQVIDLSQGGQMFTLSNNAFTNNGATDAFSGAVPKR